MSEYDWEYYKMPPRYNDIKLLSFVDGYFLLGYYPYLRRKIQSLARKLWRGLATTMRLLGAAAVARRGMNL